jgi:hypothetical protein
MGQHSEPEKAPAEQVIKELRGASFRRRRRSALFCPAGAARTASPSGGGAKGSCRSCISAGRRSFWKPARSAWPATRRDRQPRRRSRTGAGKPAR